MTKRYLTEVQDFLRTDVAGEILWLNPPFRQAGAFLMHYLDCKAKAPQSTGALLVLPYWPRRKWWSLTRFFRIVRYYPAGSYVFVQPAEDGSGRYSWLPPTKWPVVVCYDAPVSGHKDKAGSCKAINASTATVSVTAGQEVDHGKSAVGMSLSAGAVSSGDEVGKNLIYLDGRNGTSRLRVLYDCACEVSVIHEKLVHSLGL